MEGALEVVERRFLLSGTTQIGNPANQKQVLLPALGHDASINYHILILMHVEKLSSGDDVIVEHLTFHLGITEVSFISHT